MNDFLLSALLGIIEGITEFLPVSSTAHLRIAEALLGMDLGDGFWKMFSIVIQLGPILCLPIFFWKRIKGFFSTFPQGYRGDKTFLTHPIGLTAVAFVATVVPVFLLKGVIGKNLENLQAMAIALIVGGIAMWIIDNRYGANRGGSFASASEELEGMSLGQAVVIGLIQVLGPLFPGTSRSMASIAGGQIAGLSRTAALEFSFLLSIPIMAAATGYDTLKALRGSKTEDAVGVTHLDSHGWILILIGFVVSFFVAYGVVAWFMQWVRKRGFVPFAIYRVIAGIGVLIWAMQRK